VETDELLREILRLLGGEGPKPTALQGGRPAGASVEVTIRAPGQADRSQAAEVGAGGGDKARELVEELSKLTAGLDQMRAAAEAQRGELAANTRALEQNTTARGSEAWNAAKSVAGSIFSPIVKYSPLSPVIAGLAKLFGGSRPEPPPLVSYVAPPEIRYEAVLGAGPGPRAGEAGRAAEKAPPVSLPATIQVQVQAIDSRSFLDHSEAIASALREALLRSHPVADLIREG
jgi:hypothetical protein